MIRKLSKKILFFSLLCLPIAFSFTDNVYSQNVNTITLSNQQTKINLPNGGFVEDLGYESSNTKVIRLYENNVETIIKYNYKEHYFEVDGIKYYETAIMTRSTVDYSTGVTYTGKMPWKGTLSATSVVIGKLFGHTVHGTVVSAMIGAMTSELSDYYFSYTRYRSQEDYWSDYVGAYYKQECWKDIKIYKDSIAPHNLIAGPFDGSWYDPVRPF